MAAFQADFAPVDVEPIGLQIADKVIGILWSAASGPLWKSGR